MKKITAIALAALLASSTMVYAGNDHNHSDSKGSGSMAMGGMSSDMQAKMKAMKADMTAIQKESNPAKRKALMKEHMKGMNTMMGSMKSGKHSMMKDSHMDKMAKLEARLTMMEAMMEQVVVNQTVLASPDSTFVWDDNYDGYQLQ